MLLGSNDHTRTHEPHVGNDLVCSKAIPVYEIRTNEAACATKSSLAMNCNRPVLDCNHLMCQSDELLDHMQRGTGSIVEDHVQVVYSQRSEICGRVKLRVQSNNKSNVALREVREDVLERTGKDGFFHSTRVGRKSGI